MLKPNLESRNTWGRVKPVDPAPRLSGHHPSCVRANHSAWGVGPSHESNWASLVAQLVKNLMNQIRDKESNKSN